MKFAWGVLVVGAVAIMGCGGGVTDAPQLAEVKGSVTLDGKPIAGAIVAFIPDAKQGAEGPAAQATTDEAGQFTLVGSGGRSGAVIGKHVVTVTCLGPSSADPPGKTYCVVPARYSDPRDTDLRAEIVAGENTVPLELKSK